MSDIAILTIGGTVIVPIQSEPDDASARRMRGRILERIEKTGARALIIDVSAMEIIDSFMSRLLAETARMARVMGAETALVGMKKEVALTLIHLGVRMDGVRTALSLEDGMALVSRGKGGDHDSRR